MSIPDLFTMPTLWHIFALAINTCASLIALLSFVQECVMYPKGTGYSLKRTTVFAFAVFTPISMMLWILLIAKYFTVIMLAVFGIGT